jgi:hypothetical protein
MSMGRWVRVALAVAVVMLAGADRGLFIPGHLPKCIRPGMPSQDVDATLAAQGITAVCEYEVMPGGYKCVWDCQDGFLAVEFDRDHKVLCRTFRPRVRTLWAHLCAWLDQ